MNKPAILLICALLCGCSASAVKNSVKYLPGTVLRNSIEDQEVDRAVERCKVERPGEASSCSRELARHEYRVEGRRARQESAREARAASREQREEFENAVKPEAEEVAGDVAQAAVTNEEAQQVPAQPSQSDDALVDRLSENLSKVLADD